MSNNPADEMTRRWWRSLWG